MLARGQENEKRRRRRRGRRKGGDAKEDRNKEQQPIRYMDHSRGNDTPARGQTYTNVSVSRGWGVTILLVVILHASVGKYGISDFTSFLCINRDINSRNKRIGRALLEGVREDVGVPNPGFSLRSRNRLDSNNEINSILILPLSSIPNRVHIKLRQRDLIRLDLNSFIYYRSTPLGFTISRKQTQQFNQIT